LRIAHFVRLRSGPPQRAWRSVRLRLTWGGRQVQLPQAKRSWNERSERARERDPMIDYCAKPTADLLLVDAAEAVTCEPRGSDLLGRLSGGTVAIGQGRVLAVGTRREVTEAVNAESARVVDVRGMVVAPGFVDCHTHLVFGGARAREYALRLTHSAEAVRAMGIRTGIPATVAATRETRLEELTTMSLERVRRMFRSGSTTVESKSGYGLSMDGEFKQLEVNARLAQLGPARLVSTFLGAHDFPPEMHREEYVDLLVEEMIPKVAERGLAAFCDVYCDEGYYTVEQSRRVLEAGLRSGLKAKIHADAYSSIGGADLAADLGAVSADHLNHTSTEQMRKMARAGVVGVLMPALDFAVRHPRPFDARAMLDSGMSIALATDLCPACWVESMAFVMRLACRLYALSPEEAMTAATLGAARALDLDGDFGSLKPGKWADIQVWDLPCLEDLVYRLDFDPVRMVIVGGEIRVDVGSEIVAQ
jgi:imidazolonepropionase